MNSSPPGSSVHGIFQARILDNIYPWHLYQRKTQNLQDKGNISDFGGFFGGRVLLNSEHKLLPLSKLLSLIQSWDCIKHYIGASQVVLLVENSPASAGDIRDIGLIPGSGRSPGIGNGTSLQYSCLENSMYRGASQATVPVASKSQTQLRNEAHAITMLSYMKTFLWMSWSNSQIPKFLTFTYR